MNVTVYVYSVNCLINFLNGQKLEWNLGTFLYGFEANSLNKSPLDHRTFKKLVLNLEFKSRYLIWKRQERDFYFNNSIKFKSPS